jgi:hypothetical protein
MAERRRGRIAHATYVRTVGQMLTRDWYALDDCEILTQLELVDQLVASHPTRYLCRGAAVRAILDRAIAQVVAACRASSDTGSRRMADFLEARQRGLSVAAVAREWGISREYISRTVGRRAIRLVTDRVLAFGQRSLVVEESSGGSSATGEQRTA